VAAYNKAYREANKAKRAEYGKAYIKAWAAANAEKLAEYQKAYGKAHREANKEKRAAAAKAWREDNRGKITAYTVDRRARRNRATLPNVSREALIAIYERSAHLTQLTGVRHHVDHIVPLKGETVCGLHVPWNLQCIPAHENIAKGNRL